MIGVGIGVLLSAFFFKDKSHLWTSWFPGNRVIDRIEQSYWDVSPSDDCYLNCLNLDLKGLKSQLRSGDVSFSDSQTKGEEKEYQLVFTESEYLHAIRFAVKDSSARILKVDPIMNCDCP